jgi:hypothetical protein
MFEFKIFDHDDGNHPIRCHPEGFGEKEKEEVLFLLIKVNGHEVIDGKSFYEILNFKSQSVIFNHPESK